MTKVKELSGVRVAISRAYESIKKNGKVSTILRFYLPNKKWAGMYATVSVSYVNRTAEITLHNTKVEGSVKVLATSVGRYATASFGTMKHASNARLDKKPVDSIETEARMTTIGAGWAKKCVIIVHLPEQVFESGNTVEQAIAFDVTAAIGDLNHWLASDEGSDYELAIEGGRITLYQMIRSKVA